MEKVNALLIEIQKAMGCPYLSDLHTAYCPLNSQMKASILEIPLERYSLSAWNKAASYITDKKCCFKTVEEARNRITAGR